MPRAMWKGVLSFGLVEMGVELHTAEKHKEFEFKLLDRKDFNPVGCERVNKKTGKPVSYDELVKGYEYQKGRYVVLNPRDFVEASPEANDTIEILDFVERAELSPAFFERPYYIEPDKRNSKAYALLREVLERTGRVGVASVVLRTRQHICAIYPEEKALVMNLLRFAEQLEAPNELTLPPKQISRLHISRDEIEMATSLVDQMTGPWQPEKYKNEYWEDLRTLIRDKVKARKAHEIDEEPVERRPRKVAKVVDLTGLLARSLKKAHRPARKKTRAKSRRKAA